MSLRWYYRPNWSTTPSIEITENVLVYDANGSPLINITENAEEGNSGSSQIIVDDPDGEFDFPALTRIWAVQTEVAASSNTYAFHGYIADRTIRRGDSQRTSAARVWEMNMQDENSILARRVLSSPDASRPAETDVARVQWLVNHADGQALYDDTTFLSTASPVSMDAADYRGQTGQEVLSDCAQASGKNFWTWFKEGTGSAIWYGANDLTTHTSMIRLSNLLTDIDNILTFPISEDTTLQRDPSRMLSGVYFQYESSAVYVRNMAMFPQIGLRDLPYSSSNVKTRAKATSRANRYLADNDSEDDRITTSVILPNAKMNWIRAGMRIQFRATHLPGYEGFVWLRVYRRSWVQLSDQYIMLTLELGTDDIPPSPAGAEPPSSTVASATLSVGSAVHLGLGSDRLQHYASQVGVGPITTVPGKQYRFVATVIDDLNQPINGYDSMASTGVLMTDAAATFSAYSIPEATWTSPADTASLTYSANGPSWSVRNTAPSGFYGPGQIITGDWASLNSATQTTGIDMCIHGQTLSGFYGFKWVVQLELQQRDHP